MNKNLNVAKLFYLFGLLIPLIFSVIFITLIFLKDTSDLNILFGMVGGYFIILLLIITIIKEFKKN